MHSVDRYSENVHSGSEWHAGNETREKRSFYQGQFRRVVSYFTLCLNKVQRWLEVGLGSNIEVAL